MEYTDSDAKALLTPGTLQNRGALAALDGIANKAERSGSPLSLITCESMVSWIRECREIIARGVPTS